MSAFRIGADATQHQELNAHAAVGQGVATDTSRAAGQSTADLIQKAADVYTKWIPGDALVVFIVLTAAFRGTMKPGLTLTPHAWGLLLSGFGVAVGLTLLGAISAMLMPANQTNGREIVGRVLLAALAFGFWSLTVPGSWWEVNDWNSGVLAAISFAISTGFAFVAEIVVTVLRLGWSGLRSRATPN